MALKKMTLIPVLALLVSPWLFAAAEPVALSLSSSKNDVEIAATEGGWRLTVTGRDPYVFTEPFPGGTELPSTPIVHLEYKASDGVLWTVYARAEAGRQIRVPGATAASNWTPWAFSLRAAHTEKNEAMGATKLRLGLGGPVGKVVEIRNIGLRAPNARDLAAEKKVMDRLKAEVPNEIFVDNGRIRIGVDLNMGGTITHVSGGGKYENVINTHDMGREIQQSYYSGPAPFGNPHPAWKNWSWNPIGAGDVYGNRAKVVAHRLEKDRLYIKTIPLQWALDDVPGECFFETWIHLTGDQATVTCRLTNFRPDTKQYEGKHQELPALYTIGKLWRLFTYTNDRPFSGGETIEVDTVRRGNEFIWKRLACTESWSALVDDGGWGLGLIQPGCLRWLGGFTGTRNTGGPKDPHTGYLSPLYTEILDHNIVYEYTYHLVLGDVASIRKAAEALKDPSPHAWTFAKDRQHWSLEKAVDQGWPVPGRLVISITNQQASLVSPLTLWNKDVLPNLVIRAAHRLGKGAQRSMTLTWSPYGSGKSAEGSPVSIPVVADGKARDYSVDLGATGWIPGTGVFKLRLAGGGDPTPGDQVEVWGIAKEK